ncbi:acyl-CoA dehydrogenase [Neptunomonas japonica]|uniref:acyl-CoA dehydrogenase n=1 Tax=Neptunomonas japonica TaxID=417574 RepID=UPI000419DF80|nr:acyl-CoA dehydrogenase [Neptunomonas japonica]
MADYKAPVKDMQFILENISRMPQLAQLATFEDATPDMISAILEEAGRVSAEVIAPTNVVGDEQGVKLENGTVKIPDGFAQAYQQYAEGGWGSLQFDPEYGGQGLPYSLSTSVMEMWQSANMSWGLCPLLSQGAVEALYLNGSDELKNAYLPNMVSGEWTGTMNLTEPGAGSDLSVIRSKAVPEGDHYLISGQKIFITWGDHEMADNIIHLVLARLPDAPAGVRGISLFLVPKFLVSENGELGERNDVEVASLEHKLGIHASATCVMAFGENAGAVGYLIGQEGKGLACMFTMMNNARLAVGLQGVAISERAYQQALWYAGDRTQGKAVGFKEEGPILRHADIRRMLMTMKSFTEAGRALAYDACGSLDFAHALEDKELAGKEKARAAYLTPIVKGWCTEVAQEVTSLGVQIHGGMGFIEETGAAQHFRDARILPIYEGTNSIQALDLVGRKTLSDNGVAAESVMEEISVALAQASESARFKEAAGKMQSALDVAKSVTAQLLSESADNEYFSGAVAYNYMMMMGTLCGGWQLLRSGVAAEDKQAQGDSDPYLEAKQLTALFYVDQVLPRYLSYSAVVTTGSDSIMAFTDEHLEAAFS